MFYLSLAWLLPFTRGEWLGFGLARYRSFVLVPGLRAGTHCMSGSAGRIVRIIAFMFLIAFTIPAEPGIQCVPGRRPGTSMIARVPSLARQAAMKTALAFQCH